jgi:hypothetical protein
MKNTRPLILREISWDKIIYFVEWLNVSFVKRTTPLTWRRSRAANPRCTRNVYVVLLYYRTSLRYPSCTHKLYACSPPMSGLYQSRDLRCNVGSFYCSFFLKTIVHLCLYLFLCWFFIQYILLTFIRYAMTGFSPLSIFFIALFSFSQMWSR